MLTFAKQQGVLRIRLVTGCRAGRASCVLALLMFVWTVFGTTASAWLVASVALNQTRSRYAPSCVTTQRFQPDPICGKRTRHCSGPPRRLPPRAETTSIVRTRATDVFAETRRQRRTGRTCGYERSNHCRTACGYLSRNLVVTAYARPRSCRPTRVALQFRRISMATSTFLLGFNQQEFPAMRECHGVGFDDFVGQVIIGQMRLKSLDNSLVTWFSPGGCFRCSPNLGCSRNRRRRPTRGYALLQR